MLITQLPRRFSRRALPRPNLAYYLWRYVANGVRTGRALTSRTPGSDTFVLGRELAEHGIVIGPSGRFLSDDGQRALSDAAARILETSRSPTVEAQIAGASADERKKEFLVHLVSYPEGIPADDPLLRLAVDRRLLEIVSAYFGFWPHLHSIGAWLNYPTDAPPEQSQLFHRDAVDLQLVKVFIYLSDVDERSGPFTYIPGTQPFGAKALATQKLEQKKRRSDDQMARVFPAESWRVCTGPPSTMILADTVGYHRGGKPVVGRRILITFTYTSGAPIIDGTLSVRGTPQWGLSGIQKSALRRSFRTPSAARR
jgi:hypothetical protein